MSKGVLITKLLLIFVLVTGFDLWGYIGQPVPGWWNWMVTNKIYAAMMIFFFGNMIEGNVRTYLESTPVPPYPLFT